MEMDMEELMMMEDMDIPDPDELQWLESNSHFQNEDVDLDFQQTQPKHKTLIPPPKPAVITQKPPSLTPTKRFNAPVVEDPNKRIRIDPDILRNTCNDADDEDWLGESLPPPRPPPARSSVEETIVARYASQIDGDFVPVTGTCGERVYAKICRVDKVDLGKKFDIKTYSNGLIPEPISVLMERVEQDAVAKALKESFGCETDVDMPKVPVTTERLWVDKYAPNSFMELLSDEQTNREVLMWLKQWDPCVFGTDIKSTTEDVLSSLRRYTSVAQCQKKSSKNYFGKNREPWSGRENFKQYNKLEQESTDSKANQELLNKNHKGAGSLEQKILLLCGPPGLGKTTLSHVAARHCGYRVVEINASDDRSSSSIEAKILDVVQMNSIMADSKPKCLVIDEIDGALGDGKGAVDVILKMVSSERKSNSGKENVAQDERSGKVSSKNKRKDTSLLRPVICICNDLYAPALRPLRQVAKVHTFIQPTVSRIVSRLKYICNKEGMKVSSIALTALAEYTECDVRSCLNTLQFLHSKKETLNVMEIGTQVVGRKDTTRSFFDIWKEVFQKRRVKRERKLCNDSKNLLNEFEFLHSAISNRGDYDLIFDGIHENMLQLYYHDPVMQKTVKCLHSLEISDIIHQYMMRTQKMSLQVYQPAIAISIHRQIAQVDKPNIEWPKSFQRYRATLMEKVDILHSWHRKISPYISRHLSTQSFVQDSISLLLHILSPPTLRPVALHLLSEKEKNDVIQLVNIMVSYSITYKNIKSEPLPSNLRHEVAVEASALSFDPPVGELINFKGYRSSHFVLALPVKQILVHEVENQKILQAGINKSMHLTDPCKENQALPKDKNGRVPASRSDCASTQKMVNPSTSRQCEKLATPALSNSSSSEKTIVGLKLNSTGDTKKPSKGSFNFFERFRKVGSKGSQSTDTIVQIPPTKERVSRPFLFKFNEGFTNAVKRPVKMREFLL